MEAKLTAIASWSAVVVLVDEYLLLETSVEIDRVWQLSLLINYLRSWNLASNLSNASIHVLTLTSDDVVAVLIVLIME